MLVAYDTIKEKFESRYERNKFYRGLFGFKQEVKQEKSTYHYQKEGLMDCIPHIKVEDSVFIIAQKYLQELKDYFKQWGTGVEYETFKVVLEEDKRDKLKVDEDDES